MAMKRMYSRTKITAAESADLWEHWKRGEGLHVIGQALGRGAYKRFRPSTSERRHQAASAATFDTRFDDGGA